MVGRGAIPQAISWPILLSISPGDRSIDRSARGLFAAPVEMANSVLSPILRMVDKFPLWVRTATRALPSSSPSRRPPSALVAEVQDDLEALQRMLRRIQAVRNDAERREIAEEAVKLWLSELKGVAYDADDVLDEYEYELLRAEVEAEAQHGEGTPQHKRRRQEPSPSPSVVGLDASFWDRIARKIKEIRYKFEEISRERDALRLTEGDGDRRSEKTAARPATTPLVDASNIFGREEDLRQVMGRLLPSDRGDHQEGRRLLVLPIVGMGGIGKTGLAQLVYDNHQVRSRFEMRGWVCVSDDFEVEKLTRRIIECLTKKACILSELSVLQEELVGAVRGRRFLLVLDDLWNEEACLWEALRAPLACGAEGSAIIATTRNESVAKVMQAADFYPLSYLSHHHCWTIFQHSAFEGRDPGGRRPDLEDIGKKIAAKCKGLPLAAKVLGGLLQGEDDMESWEDVLQNDLWDRGDERDNGILPALKLSYLHLPSHLRRCFVFSSAFPKDFRFERDQLVPLWMAQGFLDCGNGKEAEDAGVRCFDELLKRSFFQYDAENSSFFVMHDLIHDLALYISGGEYFQIEREKQRSPPGLLRHLSLYDPRPMDAGAMSECLSRPAVKSMRTLMVVQSPWFSWVDLRVQLSLPREVVLRMEYLRALSLSGLRIGELPDSIGDLRHLRYLNLEFTDIKALPASVYRLYHLQTLNLKGCEYLRRLAEDVKNLRHLRCLRVGRLQGENALRMPRGIEGLTGLRTLDVFHVGGGGGGGDEEECGVEALEGMTHLRGVLRIMNLRNVWSAENARLADLKSKKNIKFLYLCWGGGIVGAAGPAPPDVQTKVLENLRPPKHLAELDVYEYEGLAFPTWLGDHPSPFSKLVRIGIGWCPNSGALPPLGLLPALRSLQVWGADAVESVGDEFRGASPAFPALEELEFHSMAEWAAWQGEESGGDFPRLRRLNVVSCPRLQRIVPLYDLPSLQELYLFNCESLASLEFHGGRPPSSSSTSPPPPLRRMHILRCPGLRFSQEDHQQPVLPSTLRDLRIGSDCPSLVEWCRGDDGRRLTGIPNAKFWRERGGGGGCFVSTSKLEDRNGELQVDYISVLEDE